ncbi:helix-turn-helix transcriptional regulator [bacterium]|nr:helix-turn-helix transcriptional regulator [bacterium]
MPKQIRKLNELTSLCHRRWSIPLLALLAGMEGARFVQIQRALNLSRQPLRDNLDALMDLGYIKRNPGHGHPLRPEYLLGVKGQRIAPACAKLMVFLEKNGLAELASRKWSLPVIAALAHGATRFVDLNKLLGAVSPRALALAIKSLENSGLVIRKVGGGHPPTVRYELSPPGKKLAAKLDAILV